MDAGEGGKAGERAFELADVVLYVGGDEAQYLFRELYPLSSSLLAKDGQAGLELGGLDVGYEA